MLCVGKCKALRWRLQSFALAHAMLCEDGCKALRLKSAKPAQKSLVLFWIREMEERLNIRVTVAPRKFLLNLNIINAREA